MNDVNSLLIKWQIYDVCMSPSDVIRSPTFTTRQFERSVWRFEACLKNDHLDRVQLSLHRMDGRDQPTKVYVNFSMDASGANVRETVKRKWSNICFKVGQKGPVGVEARLHKMPSEKYLRKKLIFTCLMSQSDFQYTPKEMYKLRNLRSLSNDMGRLQQQGSFFDTVLVAEKDGIERGGIKCHKAILEARMPDFAAILPTSPSSHRVFCDTVNGMSFDGLTSLLRYTYTGVLDSRVSHSIKKELYDFAEKFKVDHLLQLLQSHTEMFLLSTHLIYERSQFTWTIHSLLSWTAASEPLFRWIPLHKMSVLGFSIHLYISGEERPNETLRGTFQFLGLSRPIRMFLRMGVVNSNKSTTLFKRVQHIFLNDDPITLHPLSYKSDLELFSNKTSLIDVRFLFEFCEGAVAETSGSRTTVSALSIQLSNLERLSNDFCRLFKRVKCCDLLVQLRNGTKLPVHRVFLSARSPVLHSTVESLDLRIFTLDGVESEQAFYAFMHYIYTGKLLVLPTELHRVLMRAAHHYSIHCLYVYVVMLLQRKQLLDSSEIQMMLDF